MKCPKCSFITSNRNDVCPRCVFDLRLRKRELGIRVSQPNATLDELVAQLDGSEATEGEAVDELQHPQVQGSADQKKGGLLGRFFGKSQKSEDDELEALSRLPNEPFHDEADDEQPEEANEEAHDEEPAHHAAAVPPKPHSKPVAVPPKRSNPIANPSSSRGMGGGMQMVEAGEEASPNEFADSDVFQLLNTLHTPAEAFSESLEDSLQDSRNASEQLQASAVQNLLRSDLRTGGPSVAPTVLEFGDDADFDGALDELLGDEMSFDVTSVAVEESQKFRKASAPKWQEEWEDEEDEDEFDFSFDDDDEEEGEGEGSEESIEMLLDEEAVEVKPEESDSFLDSLMSNLQSIEAQSTQHSILSHPVPRTSGAQSSHGERPGPDKIEALRRAQLVMSRLATTDQAVLNELSLVLADAYGLQPETFTPPPVRPEDEFEVADREEVVERTRIREKLSKFKSAPSAEPMAQELNSLESELKGEVQALTDGGTKVFSVKDLLAAPIEEPSDGLPPTVSPSEEHLLSLEADLLAELNAIQGDPNPQASVLRPQPVKMPAEELEIIEENIDFPPAHSLLTASHMLNEKSPSEALPGLSDAQQMLSQELDALLGASGEEMWNAPDNTLAEFLDSPEMPPLGTPDTAFAEFSGADEVAPEEVSFDAGLSETESLLAGELESLLGLPAEELNPPGLDSPDAEFSDFDLAAASAEELEPLISDSELESLLVASDEETITDFDFGDEPLDSAPQSMEAPDSEGDTLLEAEGLLAGELEALMGGTEEEVVQNFESTPDALLAEFGLADEEEQPEPQAAAMSLGDTLPSSGEADLLASELESLLGASDSAESLPIESLSMAPVEAAPMAEMPKESDEAHMLADELDSLLGGEMENLGEPLMAETPEVLEELSAAPEVPLLEMSPPVTEDSLLVAEDSLLVADDSLLGELDALLGQNEDLPVAEVSSAPDALLEEFEMLMEEQPAPQAEEPLPPAAPLFVKDLQQTQILSRSALLQEMESENSTSEDSGPHLPKMTDSQEMRAVQLDAFLSGEFAPIDAEELKRQAEESMIASGSEYDSLLAGGEAPIEKFVREESDILAQVTQSMRLPEVELPAAKPEAPFVPVDVLRRSQSGAQIASPSNEAISEVLDEPLPSGGANPEVEDYLWFQAEDEIINFRRSSLQDEIEISAGEFSSLVQSAATDVLFSSAVEEILDPEKRKRRIESLNSGIQRKVDARELETAVLTYQREEKIYRGKQAERRMRPARTLAEMKLGARSSRLVAGAFDLVSVFGMAFFLSLIFIFNESVQGRVFLMQMPGLDDVLPDLFSAINFSVLFWLAVRVCSILGYGSGIGGRLSKLEVVDYEGRALGPKQALLRACAELTVPLTCGLSLLSAMGSTRRTFHDLLAKTLVVERTELPRTKKDDKPVRIDLKNRQLGVKNQGSNKLAPKIANPADGKSKKPLPPARPRKN